MKKLTNDNFDSNVLKSKKIAVVKWWSEYCLQCVPLGETMEKLEKKYPKINFFSANVSDVGDIATRYGIMSLPTVIVFKNGEIIHQLYGNLPKDSFEKVLDEL